MKSFQDFFLDLSAILFASFDLNQANPKGSELEELKIFIAFIIKMVVLTIIADSNDYTVRSREPLLKSNDFRLLTCSFFNRQIHEIVEIISSNKYTLESFAKVNGQIFREDRGSKVTRNHSNAGMVILYPYRKNIKEIFLHSLGLINFCKRKISLGDLLHPTLTLSTVIFWTRMKTQ